MERILRWWRNKKHQESLFLLDNNCTARICLMQPAIWNSGVFWRLATSRRDLDGKLPLKLVNFSSSTVAATHLPHLRHMAGSCAWLPRATCRSLWEPGWANRALPSNYQESLLWQLMAASDHRSCREVSGHCCKTSFPWLQAPLLAEVTSRGFKKPVPLLHP